MQRQQTAISAECCSPHDAKGREHSHDWSSRTAAMPTTSLP
eukprot:CAMPEP_0202868028 /NCGR_PEP_ID=MMETSP1391-20130828/10006_1 /ASSEMBLY_ACC=CAM_ASM_000867 /TAXON_ID=1034604 /ORGANISM="Chlamydomonas leiostraca, Strain SAG 11-49" /LENGTH=40 /DNA_ID= /DNA_START= /DNA_END= /DNA_ORIENTATION=